MVIHAQTGKVAQALCHQRTPVIISLFAVRMSSWGQSWGSQQGYNGWSWHHGSWDRRGNGMHGDKWWKCKNCAADNKSKTACAICGLRRSYADVAKQAVDRSPKKGADGKQGNPVRQHLEEVASKLAAVAAGRDTHQPSDVQANDLDVKAGKAKLAKLEAALRAMPEDDEDFANERNAITTKIAETKAGMAENRPIGARIDAARQRLTRAQQRAKEAAAALEMAQRVVEESDVEIACMRVARLGSCACTRPSGASGDQCRQHCRRGQCTVATSPEYPQRGPGSGPQPRVSCYSSLCTAHRGVSTCLRGSGTTARSSSGPAEEIAREAISKSAPSSTTHVSQNKGCEASSWRSRCSRVRRDFGLTNGQCCSGSTDSNTYSMTVATANVRTLHPKEENEIRSRFEEL